MQAFRDQPWTLYGRESSDQRTSAYHLVLPSRNRPRWVLPACDSRLMRRGFELYAPASMFGRAYKLVLQLMVLGGGRYLRKQVVRLVPSEDSVWSGIVGVIGRSEASTFAISCGTSGPDQKLTMQVLSADGRILAFAKVAETPRARDLLTNELRMLRLLTSTAVAEMVPQEVGQFEQAQCSVIVISPVGGTVPGNELDTCHWSFVSALIRPETMDLGAWLVDHTDVGTRASAASSAPPRVLRSAERLFEASRGLTFHAAVVHGDFAPWNMRRDGSSLRVFDWELGYELGPPAWDIFHFLVQVGGLVYRRSAVRILADIHAVFRGPSACEYLRAAGIASNSLPILLAAYLVAMLKGTREAGATTSPLHELRLQLLELVLKSRTFATS
jgi:hypothetical protein